MRFVEYGSAVMAKWLKQWNVTKLQLFTTNCDLFLVCCNNSISVLWVCMRTAVVVVTCCWKWIFLGLRRGDKKYRVWICYWVQYLQRFCKFVLFSQWRTSYGYCQSLKINDIQDTSVLRSVRLGGYSVRRWVRVCTGTMKPLPYQQHIPLQFTLWENAWALKCFASASFDQQELFNFLRSTGTI